MQDSTKNIVIGGEAGQGLVTVGQLQVSQLWEENRNLWTCAVRYWIYCQGSKKRIIVIDFKQCVLDAEAQDQVCPVVTGLFVTFLFKEFMCARLMQDQKGFQTV